MAKGRILEINPNEKQFLAWKALNDPLIKEIHYGGAAGGGKSWLGCESRIARAYAYPGYKSFIGRNELSRLMATVYVTFNKVCSFHKIPEDDWNFNGKYNYIEFKNGSRIDFIDLAMKPSDPLFERLGSLEYTDGWVEEAGEVPFMAVDILQSRIGRHLNEEYNITPDTLYTYNPNKGWVKRVYKQHVEKTLPADVVFIHAFYTDNPYTAKIYGAQLDRIKDKAMRARLKLGSFDYDDDPAQMIDSDAIIDLFTNTVDKSDDKALTVDVARHGVDKTVKYLWKGNRLYGVRIYAKQDTAITSVKVADTARDEKIPRSKIVVDEDGIGGAVVDQNKGCVGFIGNSTALENPQTGEKENYGNLRSQCYYGMADGINNYKYAIDIEDGQFKSEVEGITYEVWKEMLIEELEALKSKNVDKDTPLRVIGKDEIKEAIGRSPDFMDTFMMKKRLDYKSNLRTGKVKSFTPKFVGFNRIG